MSWIGDLLKAAFPLILSAAKNLADSQVDGATLNKDQLGGLYEAYVLINVHGDKLVESTDNEFDDQGLVTLSEFCADTLAEAGITVPDIPDEIRWERAA